MSVEAAGPSSRPRATNALANLYISAEPRLPLPDLVRGRRLARRPDRRAAQEGRGGRDRAPDDQGEGGHRQHGGEQTLLQQKLNELGTALNELKTARLGEGGALPPDGTRPTPTSCPRSCAAASFSRCGPISRRSSGRRPSSWSATSTGHPEVVKVRHQITETRTKIRTEAQRVIRSTENDWKAARGAGDERDGGARVRQGGGPRAEPSRRPLRHAQARGGGDEGRS